MDQGANKVNTTSADTSKAVWAIPGQNDAVVEVRQAGERFVVVAVCGDTQHRIGTRGFKELTAAQDRARYVAREFNFESSSSANELPKE
jgi:hypothetical protein